MKVMSLSAYLLEIQGDWTTEDFKLRGPVVVLADSPIEAAIMWLKHAAPEGFEPRCETDIKSVTLMGQWGSVLVKEEGDATSRLS